MNTDTSKKTDDRQHVVASKSPTSAIEQIGASQRVVPGAVPGDRRGGGAHPGRKHHWHGIRPNESAPRRGALSGTRNLGTQVEIGLVECGFMVMHLHNHALKLEGGP